MTLDEYLEEKKSICDRIKYKEARIRYFQQKANACTVSYNEMSGFNATRNMHPMEDAVCEVIDLQEEVKRIRQELSDLNDRFRESISRIGDVRLEMVLEMKYIDDATWDEIGYSMHYSRTQLHRFLSKALDALAGVDSS